MMKHTSVWNGTFPMPFGAVCWSWTTTSANAVALVGKIDSRCIIGENFGRTAGRIPRTTWSHYAFGATGCYMLDCSI
jgi:hypothetical protein